MGPVEDSYEEVWHSYNDKYVLNLQLQTAC